MPLSISGDGTITGLSAGGLPNGSVTADDLASTLDLSGKTVTGLTNDSITEGNTSAEVVDTGSDGHFKVTTEGTERLRIDSSGRLGLASNSPTAQLEIGGSVSLGTIRAAYLRYPSDSANYGRTAFEITANESGTEKSVFKIDGRGSIVGNTFEGTVFRNSGTAEIARFDTSGRFGIGTISPAYIFETSQGGIDGVVVGASLAASGNGGSGRGVGLMFKAPGSSSSVEVARIDGRQNSTSATANDATMNFMVANTSGTLTERMRIDSSGRMLVGTTSSSAGGAGSVFAQGAAGGGPGSFRTSIGTATPASGDGLGSFSFSDSGHTVAANITANRDGGTWTSGSSQPTRLVFNTTPDGSSGLAERMRITRNGYTKCTNTGDYHDAAGSYHEIRNSLSDWTHYITNTHGSAPYGIILRYPSVSPNNTSSFFQYFVDSTQPRFQVYSNGGIANFQSNNSNLCDEREKKNIEALESTWGCLKNWDLKKFHYNEDSDTDDKRYGVIAQQVAQHCPEVITEWVKQKAEPARLDDDGNEVDPAKEEIVRMGVKEQQMYWMAIKALQEAQTRIETLETANASLEARLTALEGGAN